jgi:CubicO group peptidase (beta-lactamase class C family)
MADTRTGDDDVRAAFPGNFFGHPLPNGMYRNHMWVPDIQRGATMLFGAHGQIVYADPSCDLVGVLLSFQPNPLDAINLEWVRAFNAVGDHLNASATAPKVPQQ